MSYIRIGFRPALARTSRRSKRPAAAPAAGPSPELKSPSDLSNAQLLAELLGPPPTRLAVEGGAAPSPGIPQGLAAGLPGITSPEVEAAASRRLLVARELLCRKLLAHMQGRPLVNSRDALGEWLQLHCAALDYEVFLVLYLDAQLRLIHAEQLFRGTIAEIMVYPREVLKGALAHQAYALAFAHNHPGGTTVPSASDRRFTEQLKAALQTIGVKVIDHFIVAGQSRYSFAEHGLL
ncbi:JAB domain-containing protein [Roseateles flavus]|uniref:JAB domain-containing protein n=1 Tax=Roseateles flavus TaxID=3149041 RepID=A0ABV0GGC6_9BURK